MPGPGLQIGSVLDRRARLRNTWSAAVKASASESRFLLDLRAAEHELGRGCSRAAIKD